MVLSAIRIQATESRLQEVDLYEPAARRMSLLCQSDQEYFTGRYVGAEWLTPELEAVVPHAWGEIEGTRAHFQFGGGFHHYGYSLSLDEAESSSDQSVWRLYLDRDHQESVLLTVVRLAPSERFTKEELLQLEVAGHDRQIAQGSDPQRGYQAKIQAHLRFDQVDQARAVCREMLSAHPNDWWARIVNALVTAETDSVEAGERSLRAWVEAEPDYFRWLDLAYFYQLHGLHEKAAEAIQAATAYDANTEWGHGGNSKHRGYTAALYAYQTGHYAEAVALCDHLLPVTVNGDYAKASLRRLRDAARSASLGEPALPVSWRTMSPFDPFASTGLAENLDLDELLGRKLKRPRKQDSGVRR